jgi:hypothetical protein
MKVKAMVDNSIIANTTQSVFPPALPISSYGGRSGNTVGMGATDDAEAWEELVGTRRRLDVEVLNASMTCSGLIILNSC